MEWESGGADLMKVDETAVHCSGEWNGVQWSGADSAEVEWSRVRRSGVECSAGHGSAVQTSAVARGRVE